MQVFSVARWWALCALSCYLINVVTATPARPKPSPGGGGPERLDFNLGQNGDYRFDYATGELIWSGELSKAMFL